MKKLALTVLVLLLAA